LNVTNAFGSNLSRDLVCSVQHLARVSITMLTLPEIPHSVGAQTTVLFCDPTGSGSLGRRNVRFLGSVLRFNLCDQR
jgi:hypothetical protein